MTARDDFTPLFNTLATLPSISPIVQKFSALAGNPASSADDVVGLLKLDPALAGKVLRFANSAYVGIPHSIASLKNAVVLLGQKRIFSLVLASTVFSAFKNTSPLPFPLENYWRHSVCVAMVGESIAKVLRRYGPIDSDDVFTGGLLHDIGKLALGCLAPKLVTAAAAVSHDSNIPFFKAEASESSHAVIGGALARHWNFPLHLIDALTFHHAPDAPCASEQMVLIIHVSDVLVHMAGRSTLSEETAPALESEIVSRMHVQPERLRTIANEAIQNEKNLESCIQCFR